MKSYLKILNKTIFIRIFRPSNEIGSEYLKIIKEQNPSIIKKIDKVKIKWVAQT